MNEAILVVLCIIVVVITLGVLYSMPSAFLKEFEKSFHEAINKRDEEFEKRQILNRELRKWFFGSK